MSTSNGSTFCLNPQYSTTRNVTLDVPVFQQESGCGLQQQPHLLRKKEGGLRAKGYYKKSLPGEPLISVITVVLNDAANLEKTLESVIGQSYNNIEYIVIDGGSTDDTVGIISRFQDQIDYWVSEPDNGLFFAMNHGLQIATGKWVNFMNSGDIFFNNNVVEKVFSEKREDGVFYGDVYFSYDGRNAVHVAAKPLRHFWKGMKFVHQACFVTTSLMRKYPFDTKYRLIADYNSLYAIYLSGAVFQHLDLPVCSFRAGGLSDNNPRTIAESQKMIFPVHKGLPVRLFYYCRYVECFMKYNCAKIIGQSGYALMRRLKKALIDSLHFRSN